MADNNNDPIASRWDSTTCIDYALTQRLHCHSLRYSHTKHSDHKLLLGSVDLTAPPQDYHVLVPTINYSTPPNREAPEWEQLVHDALQHIPLPATTNTEDEWTAFHTSVETALRDLYIAHHQYHPPPRWRPKGSPPTTILASAYHAPHSARNTYKQRRLRRLVGRLHELQRQHSQGRDDPQLRATIRRSWPTYLPPPTTVDQQLHNAQQALQDLLHQQHLQDLATWRARMNQSGKYATKWLANPPRAIIQQLDTPTGPANHRQPMPAGHPKLLGAPLASAHCERRTSDARVEPVRPTTTLAHDPASLDSASPSCPSATNARQQRRP